jgi:hypothetical protein
MEEQCAIAGAIRTKLRRKSAIRIVCMMRGQDKLAEMVAASSTAAGLAGGLHGREQKCYEHADDRDDDQQLNQRKPTKWMPPHKKSLRAVRTAEDERGPFSGRAPFASTSL